MPAGAWGRERWPVGDTNTSHTAAPALLPWRFIPSSFQVDEGSVFREQAPPKEPRRGAGGTLPPGRCRERVSVSPPAWASG